MTRSSTAASVAAVAICVFVPPAMADMPCPGRLEGEFKSPQYRFTYESWLLAKKGPGSSLDYQFGAAIHNGYSTPLWIDWKEMDLSGFVRGDKAFSIGSPTGECDVVDADIWYGDSPFLLSKVSAIRPRSNGFLAKLIQIATDKILDYFKRDGKVFTASDSTLYVPLDREPVPKELAEFHVQFTSEVSTADYKLGLSLQLNSDDRTKVKNFFDQSGDKVLFTALFEDPFIAHGLQRNDFPYTRSDFERNESARIFQTGDLKEPVLETYRITRLVFEDAQHRRIGTMPVAVLQPALQPLNNR
jgi:hypothetical protein